MLFSLKNANLGLKMKVMKFLGIQPNFKGWAYIELQLMRL